MSVIRTIIIGRREDPAERIVNTPSECPKCYTWIAPEKKERLYVCPECGYEGQIEDWFR